MQAITGAAAGAAATFPMTATMLLMFEGLPRREKERPLPPRTITERVAERAGVADKLDEGGRRVATIVNHFAYGAAVGALYPYIIPPTKLHPVAKGIGYGTLVWAASYLGWLPAAGIIDTVAEESKKRNLLMLSAHIVWGGFLGQLCARLGAEGADRRAAGVPM